MTRYQRRLHRSGGAFLALLGLAELARIPAAHYLGALGWLACIVGGGLAALGKLEGEPEPTRPRREPDVHEIHYDDSAVARISRDAVMFDWKDEVS